MRGAFLAVRDFAGPLQDLGYELKLESFDDRMDSRAAVTQAHAIVDNPEILCGVGPYSSRIFNEVELIFHNAGLGFIGPSTTAAFVTSSGYPEISRVVGRNDAQGAVGAQFAQAQGLTRVAILSDGTPYSQFNASHFTEEASRLGLTITSNTTTRGVRDFDSLVDRMLADEVQLVYFSSLNLEQVGTFFREARSAGYTGSFLGPDALDNPELLNSSGTSLVTGGGTYYTSMAAPASAYPGAADFVGAYTDLYGKPPPLYSAEAYDAASICIAAILQSMEARDGELPTRAEVASAVRAQDGFAGITGTYRFDRNGDPDPARYYAFQVASASPANWLRNKLVASYELPPPS